MELLDVLLNGEISNHPVVFLLDLVPLYDGVGESRVCDGKG